ncbi:kinesin-domain-containing protein [Atractiella rhizophila]|nr:kinesin-domain-containing protein [Atractiella rhizophila]
MPALVLSLSCWLHTYLRIRPPTSPANSSSSTFNHLSLSSTSTVTLTSPSGTAEQYTFTSLLPPTTSQSSVFASTALPLLSTFTDDSRDGLLFCYGTTGSGKTYTVMGGESGSQEEGLLGRSVRWVWERVGGKVEGGEGETGGGRERRGKRGLLQDILWRSFGEPSRKLASMKAEVHISYFEIYNEKIYDLLSTANSQNGVTKDGNTTLSSWLGVASPTKSSSVKRKALPLKLDKDSTTGGKSVSGLREVSIGSLDQALSLISLGRINRQVYSTLLNSTSSRSHAVFTIRIVRNGVSSKFSIVDLAGSERQVNTGTSGERLKEAGSINKSLMVLGQCLETLRENVKREREGKKTALVPFRHSKLTEIFQTFFTGEGRAAMIVTVDPFNTSYEENVHVLRFSAVAREVVLISPPPTQAIQALPPSPEKEKKRARKSIKVSVGGREDEISVDVDVEEEGQGGEEEEDPVWKRCVELWEENRRLKLLLLDERVRWSERELEIKDTMADFYEGKIKELEEQHQHDVQERIAAEEQKTNRKIDIMNRAWQASRTSITESIEEEEEPEEEDEDAVLPQDEDCEPEMLRRMKEEQSESVDSTLSIQDIDTPSRQGGIAKSLVPSQRPVLSRTGSRLAYSTNYESEESDFENDDLEDDEDVTMHGRQRSRRSSLAKSLRSIRSSRSLRSIHTNAGHTPAPARPASRASVRFLTPADEDENDEDDRGLVDDIEEDVEAEGIPTKLVRARDSTAGRTPGRIASIASLRSVRSTKNMRSVAGQEFEVEVVSAHQRAASKGRVVRRKDIVEQEDDEEEERSLVVDVDEMGMASIQRKPSRRLLSRVRGEDVGEIDGYGPSSVRKPLR